MELERLSSIAFTSLEDELWLVSGDPDLAEVARASVFANVALIVDIARGTTSLCDLAPLRAAAALPVKGEDVFAVFLDLLQR